jgi:hypothetical protein
MSKRERTQEAEKIKNEPVQKKVKLDDFSIRQKKDGDAKKMTMKPPPLASKKPIKQEHFYFKQKKIEQVTPPSKKKIAQQVPQTKPVPVPVPKPMAMPLAPSKVDVVIPLINNNNNNDKTIVPENNSDYLNLLMEKVYKKAEPTYYDRHVDEPGILKGSICTQEDGNGNFKLVELNVHGVLNTMGSMIAGKVLESLKQREIIPKKKKKKEVPPPLFVFDFLNMQHLLTKSTNCVK